MLWRCSGGVLVTMIEEIAFFEPNWLTYQYQISVNGHKNFAIGVVYWVNNRIPAFTSRSTPYTLQTLHFTLYISHSIYYPLHFTIYTLHCSLHNLNTLIAFNNAHLSSRAQKWHVLLSRLEASRRQQAANKVPPLDPPKKNFFAPHSGKPTKDPH